MGTWGPGNLQSDSALDCLGEYSSGLVQEITALAASREAAQWDECKYDRLFVLMEVFFALEKCGLISHYPDSGEAQDLKESYLSAWEAYQIANGGKWDERRKVISKTFDRLIHACAVEEHRVETSPRWIPVEPTPISDLLPDLEFIPHIVFDGFTISVPVGWSASSKGLDRSSFAPALCAQLIDENGCFLPGESKGKLGQFFFASGRSLAPEEVRVEHDPYLLIGILDFETEEDCSTEHDLVWDTVESLKNLYQGEGEHISGAYGLDLIEEEMRFVGANSFRHLEKGPNWGSKLFDQDLYFSRVSAERMLMLEFGSVRDNTDRDFVDGVLVRSICDTLRLID